MTPSAIVTDELGSIDLILRDRLIEYVSLQACSSYCRLQLLFSL